jgi:hypothetical protein
LDTEFIWVLRFLVELRGAEEVEASWSEELKGI